MVVNNHSSASGQCGLILDDLVQRVAHLPDADREPILQAVERLGGCLQETERALQESQRACQEANERFQIIADTNPLLIWMTDPRGENLYINQTYREFIGVSAEVVSGLAWGQYIHPEDVRAFSAAFYQAVREQAEFREEVRVRRADGAWRWIACYAKPRFSSDGVYLGYVGNSMDITERQQTEQALAASERKYRELIQYAPTAMYEIDFRTGRLTRVNDSLVELSGYSRDELLQMRASDLLDDEGRLLFQERVRQWLAGEKPDENAEYRVLAKDGHTIYAVLDATFTRDGNGRPLGASVIGHDVTERKKTEMALAASEARFRTFFENISEGVFIMEAVRDEQGQVVDWIYREVNPAGLDILSTTRENLLGRRVSKIRSAESMARFVKYFVPVLENGVPVEYEVSVNGRHLLTTVFRMDSNTAASAAIDITERKKVEEALHKSEAAQRVAAEAQRVAAEAQRLSAANERARANELEAVMDAAPAVIWISRDPQCREMTGNCYSYDFLHLRQGENVSRTASPATTIVRQYRMERNGSPVPASELPMQIAAATGKPAKDYAFDLVYQDGTVFHMFGNVNPLLDTEGKPYGAIGVFVDLTTVRRLQEEQISAKAEIEVQRRLMGQREQERLVIARDLHDGPVQTLSSAIFHLQMIKEVFPDLALQVELSQIGVDIRNTIHEIREVLNDLRPPALMHFGFTRMIQMYTEDLRERFADIAIELDVMDDKKLLPVEAHLALFRIYQAAIINIVRHSGASQAWVVFKMEPDSFLLELRDNGRGFETTNDFTQFTREGHFGLVGMKERAEAIGGEFSVESEPGKGTKIAIRGPVKG